jgi:hypothetical protein
LAKTLRLGQLLERDVMGGGLSRVLEGLHLSLKLFDVFLQGCFLTHDWLDVFRFDALLDVERAELGEQAIEFAGG